MAQSHPHPDLDRVDSAERYLPGYPHALFDLIKRDLSLPDKPLVVDVGCGSGRGSLPMARLGWQVVAIDPEQSLLDITAARAARQGLSIRTERGTAESTGLDLSSVDAVIAAHAFHWFDGSAALEDMLRVVRPGGGIALFWNVRDERSAIVRDHHAVLARYGVPEEMYLEADRASRTAGRQLRSTRGFYPPTVHRIPHRVIKPAEAFVGDIVRAPYARELPSEAVSRLRAAVERVAGQYVDDAGSVAIPYLLECWIARKPGR